MAKIALIDCKGDRNEGRKRMENLGLGYLASALVRSGHEVEILDAAYYGWSGDHILTQVLSLRPLLVGFSIFFNNSAESLRVVRELRGCGYRGHVTLGGHHATFNCREILAENEAVDSIISGEGEQALAELVRRLESGQEWRDLGNVASRHASGAVVVNACRPLTNDLDELGEPLRETYAAAITADRSATVITSRGCFGSCSFCSISAFHKLARGRPWRGRSAVSVAAEIGRLVSDYGVRHINFADDDFFGPGQMGRERALALAGALQEKQLGLTFLVSCRPDNLDEAVLRALKATGLVCVDVGAESWVPRQLSLFNKKITADQNHRAVDVLRRAGLEFRLYLIPFDPYVTLDELAENVAVAQQIGIRHFLDMFTFSRILVFRGTAIEEQLRRDGLLGGASGRRGYEGDLAYAFAHPEVAGLLDQWLTIQPAYGALLERARVLGSGDPHGPESLLSANLRIALRQAIAGLFKAAIAAHQDGRAQAFPETLGSEIAALDGAVARIEDAAASGVLRRCLPTRFRVGECLLDFPSSAAYDLSERLTAACARGAS
jgi:anaerobic magnesium-protoporphyrin IX monomethyl ester cyclase